MGITNASSRTLQSSAGCASVMSASAHQSPRRLLLIWSLYVITDPLEVLFYLWASAARYLGRDILSSV